VLAAALEALNAPTPNAAAASDSRNERRFIDDSSE
jgi:hypothetical protein